MESLFLLALFELKHCVVDFYLQTYHQTVLKSRYGNLVGLSHSLEHGWATLIVLLIYSLFFPILISTILIVLAIEVFLHYHIDYLKTRYGEKDVSTGRFWNHFGLDQLVHQYCYLGFVAYIVYAA